MINSPLQRLLRGTIGLALLLSLTSLSAFATTVRMQTALGDIDIQLMDAAAPATVGNFLNYVNSGAYVNSFIHRSVPGFVVQGGGFRWNSSSNAYSNIPTDPPVINEFSSSRSNLRGTVAMAKLGSDPNSATSQWFFNLADNSANLDTQNGGFTVFGQVIGNGMQVVDAIAALTRANAGGAFDSLPLITVPAGAITEQNLVMIKAVNVLPESTDISITLTLSKGWNLVGNGTNASLQVASLFNDAAKVSSVWTWQSANHTWAYYAPGADGGASHALAKGYAALTALGAGEGFWINALQDFALQLPPGAAVMPASFQNMASGWQLISIGSSRSPGAFNTDLGAMQPAAGGIAQNIATLWAWDNARSQWYFYAPSLEAQGGTALTDYIASKAYLDFTAANKTLGPGVGFWVYKP